MFVYELSGCGFESRMFSYELMFLKIRQKFYNAEERYQHFMIMMNINIISTMNKAKKTLSNIARMHLTIQSQGQKDIESTRF